MAAPGIYSFIRDVFGSAFAYVRGFTSEHRGIDLSAAKGTPIRAIQGGTVGWAGYSGDTKQGNGASPNAPTFTYGGGNVVNVAIGNGFTESYAHMDTVLVKPGQIVRPGDVIGTVGSTGLATGNHLHFAVWSDATKQFVDPLPFLKTGAAFLGAWGDNVIIAEGKILTASDIESILAKLDAAGYFTGVDGLIAKDTTRRVLSAHIGEAWTKDLQNRLQGEFGKAADAAADTPFRGIVDLAANLADPGFWIRALALLVGLALAAWGGANVLRASA